MNLITPIPLRHPQAQGGGSLLRHSAGQGEGEWMAMANTGGEIWSTRVIKYVYKMA